MDCNIVEKVPLKISEISTKLGVMLAAGDEEKLYLLKFTDSRSFDRTVTRIRSQSLFTVVLGSSRSIQSIESELTLYFEGRLQMFRTPVEFWGTLFQKVVWTGLMKIPFGKTESYRGQAERLKRPTAVRAVACANAANPLSLIVPCHRIIRSNGQLGGYGGRVWRKKWLIEHERIHRNEE